MTDNIYNKHFWVWFNGNVWNNDAYNQVGFDIGSGLVADQTTMAMGVYPNGELHAFANGKDVGTPFQNIPIDVQIYGALGLENNGVHGSFKLGE